MLAYAHVRIAKTPGPIRRKIAADAAMKIQQQGFVERPARKQFVFDVLLDFEHALGQQRRELRVGEDAARGFYEARGVRRLCRVFSHSKSTGSPSNAMLAATWRGTSAQRRALRSAGFSFRHCETFFCQVMETIYMNEPVGKSTDLTQRRQGAKSQRKNRIASRLGVFVPLR